MSEFILLGNTTKSQMFGCVIKTDKHTIVIDGGTMGDEKQLADLLAQSADSHVDAWFFTHPHHDHIGCFVNLLKNYPDIKIDKVYHHFPDYETVRPHIRTETEGALVADFFKICRDRQTIALSRGDVFDFDGVTLRVLRVYNPAITENFINNTSTVYRIEGENASFLILGDLGIEGGCELMKNCPKELLQADYTQMAHHGQSGVSREFYEYIRPQKCIWPAPDWLWDNDAGNGFDTGPWHTVRTREWMQALGITEHIVEKDGMQKIVF